MNLSVSSLYINDIKNRFRRVARTPDIPLIPSNFLRNQKVPSNKKNCVTKPHLSVRRLVHLKTGNNMKQVMTLKTNKRRRRNGRTKYHKAPKMIVSQREKIPAFLQNLEYRKKTYHVQNVKGLLFTDIETKNDLIKIPIERLNVVERSIDETEEQMICVENNIDTTECNKDFVAWIASPRECYCIPDEKWNDFIRCFEICKKLKPNVNRGKLRNGITSSYFCFGFRKEPKSNSLGTYCFHPSVDGIIADNIDQIIKCLVHELEKVTDPFFKNISSIEKFASLKKQWNIPAITQQGIYTQFSVAKNYWSPLHTDNDYMYTTLSVCSSNEESIGEVLYYFNFPTVGISIPLYHGSVIVFDPSVPHCASNPSFADCYIMSAYISQKTVNTHVSNSDEFV
jgi:hypothetical protein